MRWMFLALILWAAPAFAGADTTRVMQDGKEIITISRDMETVEQVKALLADGLNVAKETLGIMAPTVEEAWHLLVRFERIRAVKSLATMLGVAGLMAIAVYWGVRLGRFLLAGAKKAGVGDEDPWVVGAIFCGVGCTAAFLVGAVNLVGFIQSDHWLRLMTPELYAVRDVIAMAKGEMPF